MIPRVLGWIRIAWATLAVMLAILVAASAQACSHLSPYRDQRYPPPTTADATDIDLRILLVGDAGEPDGLVLSELRAWSTERTGQTLVVFLGDNVYPEGVTPARRLDAERRLARQVAAVEAASAMALFIPGNHDWADGSDAGLEAVRAQEAFLRDRARFLPSGGCPGPEVLDLPEHEPLVRLVVLDTQWWLHDGPKPTAACRPGSPSGVVQALGAALDTDLAVVVAAHHPLATYGRHGGFYDWRAHIFPLTHLAGWLWLPLPGIGSVYPLVRTRLMDSDQDLSGSENRTMRQALSGALASRTRRGPVVYAAGHDHSLQVLRADVVDYVLVSGAGSRSKITAVGSGPDTLFAHEHPGFMALDVTADTMHLSVVEPRRGGGRDVAFSLAIPIVGE